jgi:Secretion system C-terminal sorting domain
LQDSTFLVAGWSRDTLFNDHLDFELLKYNWHGQLMTRFSIANPYCIVSEREDTHSEVNGIYVQFEQSILDDTYSQTLYWFNDQLDTLFSRIVQSPFLDSTWIDSDFMYSQYATLSEDTCLFYSFGVWKPETTGNDVCIKKLSPTGEELWTYIYATYAEVDACYALLPQEDGGVIAGIYQTTVDGNPSQDKLIKIDSSGDEQWQIDVPGGYITKLINCIISDEDNLVMSGRYHAINEPSSGTLPITLKVDTLGNVIWATIAGEYEQDNRKDYTNVVQTCDSNYVAGGTWWSFPGSEEIIQGQNNADYDSFAHIVKLDRNNGGIIWERQYRFLQVYQDNHILVDMKATLDGGVIFCGEARDSYGVLDDPRQQGWLVKLDECGCLVPGCDSLCGYVGCGVADTAFFPVFGNHFIIGPNPANDFLNIYVGSLEYLNRESLNFTLYDVQGKLVYEFVPTEINTTYMLSTERFASGLYVLTLRNDGGVLQQQKLVISK